MIVNALQRRADVVVQKSLAEGFGLTVTEAMWKDRPVVAGRVGGIVEQIDDGVHGVLVDPRDLGAFGHALDALFEDPDRAAALGRAAHERVRDRFLPPHYLAANLDVIEAVLAERRRPAQDSLTTWPVSCTRRSVWPEWTRSPSTHDLVGIEVAELRERRQHVLQRLLGRLRLSVSTDELGVLGHLVRARRGSRR